MNGFHKVLPAINAARASKSRAHIKGESLIVDGKRYSYNKLDQLPKSIKLGTKSNDDIVGFFGKSSEFSNFHPSDFTIDSIPYNCTEQYYQSHKAEEFDDAETRRQAIKSLISGLEDLFPSHLPAMLINLKEILSRTQ